MNLIKSCCLFVVFSSFLACTPQVSDVKSVSYTEFVNPFIGTDFTGNTYPGAPYRKGQSLIIFGLEGFIGPHTMRMI